MIPIIAGAARSICGGGVKNKVVGQHPNAVRPYEGGPGNHIKTGQGQNTPTDFGHQRPPDHTRDKNNA